MDKTGGHGDGGRVSSAGGGRVTNSETFPLPASLLILLAVMLDGGRARWLGRIKSRR